MEIRQIIRIMVFGYFSFLPNLLSYWIAAIFPEVIEKNLLVTNKEDVSRVAGLFFAFYFFGIIVGAICWPYILMFISKKKSILLGLFFQGVFTALTGRSIILYWVYTFRFWTGFFNNVNTVGKDFIFEFAKPNYRQYAFTAKSCFTVCGIFVGPIIGYMIYKHCGSDLEASMMFLFWLYMLACVLFIIVFMIDFKKTTEEELIEVEPSKINEHDIEESAVLLAKEEVNLQKGIFEVLKIMWNNKILRNFTIVYFLTNGIFTTRNFVLIFYLESTWEDQGLGISAYDVSFVNFYTFFFCIAFLMTSPIYVPSKISYLSVVKNIVFMALFLTILPPLLRDLLPNSTERQYKFVICLVYGISNFFNPKLFSPFINYFLNSQIDRYGRTALNSITFISSCLSAAIIMTFISPLLSISLHNEHFIAYRPWNKYFCFVILDLLLACNLFYLKTQKGFIR